MRAILLVVVVLFGAAAVARADTPGADWMTKEQVIQKLQGMGYSKHPEARGGRRPLGG